jgi:putative redox protein
MTISAQLNWTEGLQFIARASNGPAVVIDSSDGGSGASPMELVLIGVAGCSAIDVVMIMQKKRADIVDFKVNISGERAEDHPKRYTRIQVEYVFYGRGIKPNAVEQAIELSETKYCSASASLNAQIDSTYRIIETE